jgi:hypothetical protein
MKRYKFLRKNLKSENGNHKWKKGQWYKTEGNLMMCLRGFHCSKGIYQAFSYVHGELLTEVEVKGKSIKEDDKEVWEKMKVTKVWKWTKTDSVLFSIYAARLTLNIFEEKYPDDKRPRLAIESAEKYLKNPNKKNKVAANAAADAAYAAYAAYAAADAADAADAAYAAYAAADAANAANAAYAAYAAYAAANAAEYAAADAAIYKKLEAWMKKHLVELKELK